MHNYICYNIIIYLYCCVHTHIMYMYDTRYLVD